MKIRHWEALGNEDYMRDCYAPSDAMRNLGGLTLISPMYFEFGLKLMSVIRTLISKKVVKSNKNVCISHAEDALDNDESLKQQFLQCDVISLVSDDERLKIYKQIWKKAIHARAGVEIRKVNEDTTSRYAKGATNLAFRTELDAGCKSTSVGRCIALEAVVMKEFNK
jgi:hypothetical protein